MFGQRPERQQQHLRARPGALQVGVGPVPQRLESGSVPLDARLRITLRQREFRQIRIFVDTGDGGAPMSDVVRPAVTHLGDLLGDEVAGLGETATRLDVLQVLPGLPGEGRGEVLDEPRSAGRVQHPTDMRFLQQQ